MSFELEIDDDDFAVIDNDGIDNVFTVHHGTFPICLIFPFWNFEDVGAGLSE